MYVTTNTMTSPVTKTAKTSKWLRLQCQKMTLKVVLDEQSCHFELKYLSFWEFAQLYMRIVPGNQEFICLRNRVYMQFLTGRMVLYHPLM